MSLLVLLTTANNPDGKFGVVGRKSNFWLMISLLTTLINLARTYQKIAVLPKISPSTHHIFCVILTFCYYFRNVMIFLMYSSDLLRQFLFTDINDRVHFSPIWTDVLVFTRLKSQSIIKWTSSVCCISAMMPAYSDNRFYAIYFILFLAIGMCVHYPFNIWPHVRIVFSRSYFSLLTPTKNLRIVLHIIPK